MAKAKRFRATPFEIKKLRMHGLMDEWVEKRTAIGKDRSVPPERKGHMYRDAINELVDICDDIEAGNRTPTPGSDYEDNPKEAQQLTATAKGMAPTAEDCEWAYQNLDTENVDITTAPSPGAVSLRKRAKSDHNVFKWMLDKMSPKTFAGEKDTIDRRALDLTGVEKNIYSDWQKCLKVIESEGI